MAMAMIQMFFCIMLNSLNDIINITINIYDDIARDVFHYFHYNRQIESFFRYNSIDIATFTVFSTVEEKKTYSEGPNRRI